MLGEKNFYIIRNNNIGDSGGVDSPPGDATYSGGGSVFSI